MSSNTKVAAAIVAVVCLLAWAMFGYGVLVWAFVSTTGALQVLLGVYIIGSLLVWGLSLFVRSLLARR